MKSEGESSYELKKRSIELSKKQILNPDRVKGAGASVAQNIAREISTIASNIQENLTPAFITRIRNKSRYVTRIEEMEEFVTEIRENVNKTIDENLKIDEETKADIKRIRKRLRREKAGNDIQREVIEEAKIEEAKLDFEDFRERQRRITEAYEENLANEWKNRQLEIEAETQRIRDWRQNYWGEQSSTLREEAAENRAMQQKKIEARNNKAIDNTYDQWGKRGVARARMQVEVPSLSETVTLPGGDKLGVFGIPMEPGAYHSLVGGGYNPGLDQYEIQLFSSEPHTEFEMQNIEKVDSAAELAKTQALYDSLQSEAKRLDQAMKRICQLREDAERDHFQVCQELLVVDRDQLGPPRRLPVPNEINSTAMRKEKQSILKQHIDELQHTIDVAHAKKLDAESQMLTLAKTLASLRQQSKSMDRSVSEVNQGLGMLPMVVGRNITAVPGLDETAKPLEMYNAVTQQSKFITYQDMGASAQKAHREVVKYDRKIWIARQGDSDVKFDMDRTLNNLADISERLQAAFSNTIRMNLVDAIQGFHNSGTSLFVVKRHLSGPLSWWCNRRKDLCVNISPYIGGGALGGVSFEPEEEVSPDSLSLEESVENSVEVVASRMRWGVTIDEPGRGVCTGEISLPKVALWRIFLSVARKVVQKDSREDTSDRSDFCTVYLGPSLDCLGKIGVYHNVKNAKLGVVLYDVRYVLKSSVLAFRLEFSSSDSNAANHLAIGTGIFEEFEPIGLEIQDNHQGLGGERVLSSFVKILRIEQSQGKLRLNKLLEELIQVEQSVDTRWYSSVIMGFKQSYNREIFLRILQAEILMEYRKEQLKVMKQQHRKSTLGGSSNHEEEDDVDSEIEDENSHRLPTTINLSVDKILRLQKSMTNYLLRKRFSQQPKIKAAMDLKGKRIDVFEAASKKWKHVIVLDCFVRWIENGITAKMFHVLQEFNTLNELVGNKFQADISNSKYFETPAQLYDEESIRRHRMELVWTSELVRIDKTTEDSLTKAVDGFDKTKAIEISAVKKANEAMLREIEESLEKRVSEQLKTKEVKRALKISAKNIIDEIKAGIVKADPIIGLKRQAEHLAVERFRNDWKTARREQGEADAQRRMQELETNLQKRYDSLMKKMTNMRRAANKSKREIMQEMKQQKQSEKEMHLARVKFTSDQFRLAVPQAAYCEHLRSKAWGGSYATGVRCLDCRKELTELHLEESQVLGYGSGCDYSLYDAVKRHRAHEAAFKFKSSEELQRVEAERIRLEKERREVETSEISFYDFHEIKAVYDFDRRHANEFKQASVFRQGVQWNEYEIAEFEKKAKLTEEKRLADSGLIFTNIEKFDPLHVLGNPPPTFRAQDDQRKAQYGELMYAMGRLNNFRTRISELKNIRVDLIITKKIYAEVLKTMHQQSFSIEVEVKRLEEDLQKTSQLSFIYQKSMKLYKKSIAFLEAAKNGKRRAEMARCGVWETVSEERDVLDEVHDQTRELLKMKFTFELDTTVRRRVLDDCHTKLKTKQVAYEDQDKVASGLLYCEPGSVIYTKYGMCKVKLFRSKDQMLMVTLNFCSPPAKAWLHAPEVISRDRAQQHSERILMELEDSMSRSVSVAERIEIKRELFLMQREEEGMKEYYALIDVRSQHAKQLEDQIATAVNDAYTVIGSKQYRALHKSRMKDEMQRQIEKHNESIKNYKGRRNEKPKPLTFWSMRKLRTKVNLELKNRFLEEMGEKAERVMRQRMELERFERMTVLTQTLLLESALKEFLKDICTEALQEGMWAKKRAEFSSGIYFHHPQWMQYGPYCQLRDLWKSRKQELMGLIEKTLSVHKQFESDSSDMATQTEKDSVVELQLKREKALERKRQKRICHEMEEEERKSRAFYRWELLENLRERRLMRDEEKLTRQVMQENERLQQAVQSHYNVSHFTQEEQERMASISAYERRRLELKAIALERRRIAEENVLMAEEDKLGEALRVFVRLEEQRKLLLAELGSLGEEGDLHDGTFVDAKGVRRVRVPAWMPLPKNWTKLLLADQLMYVIRMQKWKVRQVNIEKNLERDRRRMLVVQARGHEEWQTLYDVMQHRAWKAELEYMTAEEDCREAESRVHELKENIRRMNVYCQQKGEEELKVRARFRKKELHAKRCDRALQDASAWLDVCSKRFRRLVRVKGRAEAHCLWLDTDSINGYPQRFRTEILRGCLYKFYFSKLVMSIVTRSEIIATERKIMTIQEALSSNYAQLMSKSSQLNSLWKEYQREELMRLKRSALNLQYRFFPHSRKKVLEDCFGSWVRFHLWNRGHREAFELKYELIKTQLDIERQYKDQLLKSKEKETQSKKIAPTTMQIHKERTVICKLCRTFYLESQNHSMICKFHHGKFSMECPRTCLDPGHTPLCISHRRRRWTCCDNTAQKSVGCSRRYHIPADSDSIYDKIMEKVNERDVEMLSSLDSKLAIARKEDWSKQVIESKRKVIMSIEDTLSAERAIAARFADLKFV